MDIAPIKYLQYPVGKVIKEYIFIFLGLFPFALMVNWIFVPHNVVGAGLTGICSIIYYATQGFFPQVFAEYGGAIPLWLSSLSINAILLIIAMLTVGWRFCVRTLVGALALAFWYRVIPMRVDPLIADPVTACIVGGVVFGMSLGIVMLNNGSSGGTDIVAMIIHNYRDVSLGRVMVICDAIIIASSYFLPIPEQFYIEGMDIVDFKIKRILYGLCMTVSYTAALDWIMSRMRQSVQFMIFSRNYRKIADAINATGRGVTVLDGTGWYTRTERKVIVVLVKKRESINIFRMIKSIDPYAFVSMGNVQGVYGEGFDQIKASNKSNKGKKTIVLASNNQHKLDEIRSILGDKFEVRSLEDIGCRDDIPETSGTLEGNALQKAEYIKQFYGYDCFADDTGL